MCTVMRKLIVTIVLFPLLPVLISAQDFPSYGIVSPSEMAMTECIFDKDASAVVLLDEAMSNYNDRYNLITTRHIRIKILKENGFNYANVSIPFYRKDDFELIHDIKGMVINRNADGVTTKKELERKAVYKTNTSELYGEVTFAFPDVRVGSVIEYVYTSSMKHYGGLRDWYFQTGIPVIESKYHLYIIPGYEFAYQVHKSAQLNISIEPDRQNGSVKFAMKDVPGLEDEPYMDSRQDYIQRVVFQLSGHKNDGFSKQKYITSWKELNKEWLNRSDFGGQLNKELPGADAFIQSVKAIPSPFEKMKQVFTYVQANLTWDGFNSIISNDGVKSVWNKKKGNSGEINLALVNLLQSVGVVAYPMLVSERAHGKVNTQYPFIDQFNTVYAAVSIDEKKYYLNAVDQLTPAHIIPHKILNTTAFIVSKKAGGLVEIKDESLQYRDIISIIASVTADGNIEGQAFMTSADYARVFRLHGYKRNPENYISENFKKTNVEIDSFNIINADIDSLALQQRFDFKAAMQGSGEYRFFPMTLFSGLESNPFISDKRFSDINFGFRRYIASAAYIQVPPNLTIDVLPKSIRLVNPDNTIDFSREILMDEATRKLVIRIKMDFRRSFYAVDEYDTIKEFYKKMFELLNEQVVLKTK